MFVRNRRGNRPGRMKARLAVAAAVLVGGAAIGVAAVAASSHSGSPSAQSAGYSSTLNFHHQVSEGTALRMALSDWTTSQQKSLKTLAAMAPMKSFSTVRHGNTVFAVQRGVVALASKHWLLVKSSNGSLHLWLLNGATKTKNVANSVTGTRAMTGNTMATTAAMGQGNMAPAAQVMAGSTTMVNAFNNPAPKPITFTVAIAGSSETITITITPSTATVAPTTNQVARQVAQQTGTTVTRTTQRTFAATDHIARGDLVLVAGVKKHGVLEARLVLFSAPGQTVTPTPTGSASATATPTTTTPTTTTPTTSTPTTVVPAPTPTGVATHT